MSEEEVGVMDAEAMDELEATEEALEKAQDYEASAEDIQGSSYSRDNDISNSYKKGKDEREHEDSGEETLEKKVIDIKEARAKVSRNSKNKDISDILDKEESSDKTRLEEFLDDGLVDRIQKYLEKQHYSWKEIWYILKGFTRVEGNEDIYKKIDRIAEDGSPILVLMPGLASFPVNGEDFEKYSGYNTVRIPRLGADETHKVLSRIMDKTRMGAIVVGFSDGEKDFCDYLRKYGDEGLVSAVYCTGSDKGKVEKLMDPSRVFYINGGNDHLAPALDKFFGRYEVGYGAKTSRPLYTVDSATHASLVHNPWDVAKVAEIIGRTAKAKYFDYNVRKAA